MRTVGLTALMVVLVSCAHSRTGGTSLADTSFPKPAELAALANKPANIDEAMLTQVVVDRWALEGPFPSTIGVTKRTPAEKEEKIVAAALASSITYSEDMRCIAREAGRFYLSHKSFPKDSLETFIRTHCASLATYADLVSVYGSLPEGLHLADVPQEWWDKLQKDATTVPANATVAGAWAGELNGLVVFVIAYGRTEVELSAQLSTSPTGNSVTLRGRAPNHNAERIDAMVNVGSVGYATCKTLGALRPPDFAFECPLERKDASTQLEIAAFESGRLLGDGVMNATLWLSSAPSKEWVRTTKTAEVSPGQLNEAFVAAVNRLRTEAKLEPLTFEGKASDDAAGLAPAYFAAAFDPQRRADTDLVALGMMAGWSVSTDIVSAGFGSASIRGSRDVDVLVEQILSSPFQRRALLDARSKHVAIGSLDAVAPKSMFVIYSTYVPLGKFVRKEAEIAVITRLNQMRVDRQLPTAQWTLWPKDEGALVETSLKTSAWSPNDAMQHVLNKTAEVSRGRVQGYVQLVDDLEHFQFPTEVLTRKNVNVFVAIGTYKHKDAAHTRYVVCFVLAEQGDIEVAMR